MFKLIISICDRRHQVYLPIFSLVIDLNVCMFLLHTLITFFDSAIDAKVMSQM